MKKRLIGVRALLLIGFTALLVIGFGLFLLSKSRDFQLFGTLINRVETGEKIIALTFDDGPLPGATERIRELLAAEKASATFFLTGQSIEKFPELAKKLMEDGHQIGNHSYSHQRMVFMSYEEIIFEIDKTNQLIRGLGYDDEIVFRPPYGKKLMGLPYYLSQQNITTVTWDIEPESNSVISQSSDAIAQHVVENAKPGSIILLHVMFRSREPSMQAVPKILSQLKEKGYRFVTVNELLKNESVK